MANDLSLYYKYRKDLRTGDLLTYRTDGVISSAIRHWSPGANHAGMVLSLDEYAGEECRRWTLESTAHGPRMAYLSTLLERLEGEAYWHRLKPEITSGQRIACGGWALTQQGVTKYDFKSALLWPFRAVSADIDKLLCSEYVQMSWAMGGIISMKLNELISMPSDLPNAGVTLPPVLIVQHKPLVQIPIAIVTNNP